MSVCKKHGFSPQTVEQIRGSLRALVLSFAGGFRPDETTGLMVALIAEQEFTKAYPQDGPVAPKKTRTRKAKGEPEPVVPLWSGLGNAINAGIVPNVRDARPDPDLDLEGTPA